MEECHECNHRQLLCLLLLSSSKSPEQSHHRSTTADLLQHLIIRSPTRSSLQVYFTMSPQTLALNPIFPAYLNLPRK
jgi:hypothetical protein